MSLMEFVEEAGEKLLGGAAGQSGTGNKASGSAPPAASANIAALNAAAGEAIAKYVATQNLTAQNLNVAYDGATKTVTLTGMAPDQATKEKIALCCGNVHSVSKVDDQLTVAQSAPASTFYEVKSGDTLSKIAKSEYGDANAYMKIFEANKPLLADPNKIYPGQKLRIPPKA